MSIRPYALRWLACAGHAIGWFAIAPVAAGAPEPAPPIELTADRLTSTTDRETIAEGRVTLRQGNLRIQADRLRYQPPADRAAAEGGVLIERDGAVYRGDALDIAVRDFSGWFIAPEFEFPLLGTRGQATRIDFASRTRLTATEARYTSCPRPADDDASDDEPDWQLQARRITLDFDANEGRAEGARLRFLGMTLLPLPRVTFPVTGARKTGWLPPTLRLDSRSGLDLAVPWYWNIAPDLDLTLEPRLITRRGLAANAEARYLAADHEGRIEAEWLPDDQVTGGERHLVALRHRHDLGRAGTLRVEGMRVSDDAWWKDFPRHEGVITPRLLASSARLDRGWTFGALDLQTYAQAQHWQVLQDAAAPIVAPYARLPRLGVAGRSGPGRLGPFVLGFETELNRFVLTRNDVPGTRPEGWRWHALGHLALPWRAGGLQIEPRLSFNAARYLTDEPMANGRRDAARTIPTLSLDASLRFERDTGPLFGRALRQTLEPRLLWVRTPYRRQDELPNFDSWDKDFNLGSIYATNAFSGIDRVSDAHQLTAGATSRLIDPDNGAELLRAGIVQRVRFADQRVAPKADGGVDGPVQDQRLSDVLLFGSTTLLPAWTLDATLQYSPDNGRLRRSVLGATYNPGPFRTVSGRYRLARGTSEQFELGWQWPLFETPSGAATGGGCSGAWYGVGRLNYSMKDSRLTDALVGTEYDAGCWILRLVGERQSTGSSAAATRLMIQLELVGLSRLGTNPLQVLKDNIPGYRLLRESDEAPDRATTTP